MASSSADEDTYDSPGLKALFYWRDMHVKALMWADRMAALRMGASLQEHWETETGAHLARLKDSSAPCMNQYMNDGWSIFLWNVKAQNIQGKRTRTCSKVRRELLLERSILKSISGTGLEMSMNFGAPRPLSEGRTAWHVFGAMCEWQEPLRAFTEAPIWNFYVFDGHLQSPLTRLACARHSMYYQTRTAQRCDKISNQCMLLWVMLWPGVLVWLQLKKLSGKDFGFFICSISISVQSCPGVRTDPTSSKEQTLALRDFTLGVRCLSHIFSLSTKHGTSWYATADLLDNLHLALKSARSATTELSKKISQFVAERGSVVERPQGFTNEILSRSKFWKLIVVNPTLLDCLEDSGFWYDPVTQSYSVYRDFLSQSGASEALAACLRCMCHFQDFKQARWVAVGQSSRMWWGGLCTGLDQLVASCTADPNVNMSNLGGHADGKEPSVRYLSVLSMFTACISETPAAMLIEDNRFLKHHKQLWEAMVHEMEYASGLEMGFWQLFLPFIGGDQSAAQLRDDVLLSCHRCMAFAWKDAFKQLTEYPLCLAVGDLKQNLQDLLSRPLDDLHNSIARQYWLAINDGWAMELAVEHLGLLPEAGFSTDMVEQSHGFGRSTMLSHSQLGLPMLQARSMVMQSSGAFTRSREQARVRALEAKLNELEEQLGKRFDGTDLFRSRHLKAALVLRSFPWMFLKTNSSPP